MPYLFRAFHFWVGVSLARLYFCCFLATHIFSAWAVFHHWVTTLLAFSIINHPPTWTNCLYSSSISPMIIAESIIYIRAVYIYSKYATQCYIYLVLYIFSFSLVSKCVCSVRRSVIIMPLSLYFEFLLRWNQGPWCDVARRN